MAIVYKTPVFLSLTRFFLSITFYTRVEKETEPQELIKSYSLSIDFDQIRRGGYRIHFTP